MIYYYLKILFKKLKLPWVKPLLILLLIYLIGLNLLILEPNNFGSVFEYTWWFFVTTTTVGYGDVSPITTVGKIIGLIVMSGGIGIVAFSITEMSEFFTNKNRNKMLGKNKVKFKDHTIIFGYKDVYTKKIIDQLLVDNPKEKIVLATNVIDSNNDDRFTFVYGDLKSDEVKDNVNLNKAKKIIIYTDNDDKTLSTVLTVVNSIKKINSNPHIVIALDDTELKNTIHELVDNLDLNVEIITDIRSSVISQSINDSGASIMIDKMLSNDKDATIYQLTYNNDNDNVITYLDLFFDFKKKHDAILIGVSNGGNKENDYCLVPENDYLITEGTIIYYLCNQRIYL